MKPSRVLLAAAAPLVAAVAASSRVSAAPHADRQAAILRLPPAALAGQIGSYGHIKR
jgi:hypothetical protein